MPVVVKRATDPSELEGIKALQSANLRRLLAPEEVSKEGFVTAEYSLEFLRVMHEACPSVIAADGDRVVGYALVATKATRHRNELLGHLFEVIDGCVHDGKPLRDRNYVVCGQLCVARGYRGLGLATRMYGHFRDALSTDHECVLTDIARDNSRSLHAHLRIGFEVLGSLSHAGEAWDVVIWDWRREA